mgnify:CR=1 FL=1
MPGPLAGVKVIEIAQEIQGPYAGLFLADIEKTRGNAARSRNTRLAAIRSFFKYVAVNEPQVLQHCQRVLAMPSKRHEKRAIDYMTRDEIEAVIAAPDITTWYGRRDRAILMLTLQTGLRVTELITLTCNDIALGTGETRVELLPRDPPGRARAVPWSSARAARSSRGRSRRRRGSRPSPR